MDVKEAVALAKSYILALFKGEDIKNLGLEEVELDQQENEWIVTIGFSRPWDESPSPLNPLSAISSSSTLRRSFKIVRISNSGEVMSVKAREVQV